MTSFFCDKDNTDNILWCYPHHEDGSWEVINGLWTLVVHEDGYRAEVKQTGKEIEVRRMLFSTPMPKFSHQREYNEACVWARENVVATCKPSKCEIKEIEEEPDEIPF